MHVPQDSMWHLLCKIFWFLGTKRGPYSCPGSKSPHQNFWIRLGPKIPVAVMQRVAKCLVSWASVANCISIHSIMSCPVVSLCERPCHNSRDDPIVLYSVRWSDPYCLVLSIRRSPDRLLTADHLSSFLRVHVGWCPTSASDLQAVRLAMTYRKR